MTHSHIIRGRPPTPRLWHCSPGSRITLAGDDCFTLPSRRPGLYEVWGWGWMEAKGMKNTKLSISAQIVYEHVVRNPGVIARRIAASTGLPLTSVHRALRRLEALQMIESSGLRRAPGHGYSIKPYRAIQPSRRTDIAVAGIISRARRIGGPFGIIAAQVMT